MLALALKEELEKQLTEIFSRQVIIGNHKSVSGGCINETIKLETNFKTFFLKINSAKKFPGMFEAEAKGLRLLAKANEIKIPSVVLFGQHDDSSFLILEWMEQEKRKKDFFIDFGRKLARLHKHTGKYFGLDHNNYIGSLPQSNQPYKNGIDFFIEQRLMKQIEFAVSNNAINNSTIEQFNKLFKKLSEIIPNESPALLHGDLWSGNYMTDENGAAALIDPAVYYGFREADIAMTKLFGGFDSEFYYAYNEVFALENGWEARLDILNLYPLMVHVNLFGGGYIEQVRQILRKY
ncbi:MAG TPA: fructosamine kinase family protein [Bacteroidia bacterium]|nr:fructosamine kinase family protein [Bacteroidia bacterium]